LIKLSYSYEAGEEISAYFLTHEATTPTLEATSSTLEWLSCC